LNAIDNSNVVWSIVWAAAGLLGVALALGLSSNSAPASALKASKRLLATVIAGLAISTGALAVALHEWQRPYQIEGLIERVSIRKGRRQSVSTEFGVRVRSSARGMQPGGEVSLTVDGTSQYFQAGQLVKIKYEPHSHDVGEAQFLSDDGKEEETFYSDMMGWIYCSPIAGIAIVVAGLIKFRRDPRGREMGGNSPETQLRIFDPPDSLS